MANKVNWDGAPSFTSRITTGANSLADGSSVLSAAYDNTSLLDEFAAIRLSLASLNPTGSPFVELHICASYDGGTTFADLCDGTRVAGIIVTTGSGAKEACLIRVEIPPLFFKWGILNRTNVAFGASGNILGTGHYNDEIQ